MSLAPSGLGYPQEVWRVPAQPTRWLFSCLLECIFTVFPLFWYPERALQIPVAFSEVLLRIWGYPHSILGIFTACLQNASSVFQGPRNMFPVVPTASALDMFSQVRAITYRECSQRVFRGMYSMLWRDDRGLKEIRKEVGEDLQGETQTQFQEVMCATGS